MDNLTQLDFQFSPHNSIASRQLRVTSLSARIGNSGIWSLRSGLLSLWFSGSIGLLTSIVLLGLVHPVQAQTYPAGVGVLQMNDQGAAVSDLQSRLAELGYYNGAANGQFDASTQAAVLRFQQANGLSADGVVGAATTRALGYSPSTAAQSGAEAYAGSQVADLQRQLTQLGYYNGSPTGTFDSQTQAAVMSFQRDRGLAVDGIVGSATEAALYQTPSLATGTASVEAAATYTPSATQNDGFLQLGDAGSEVSNLQTRLQALGYYDGPISGSFGSQTEVALKAFQQAQGLTADGIAGPQVNASLDSTASTASTASAVPAQTAETQTITPPITGQPAQVSTATATTSPPAVPQTTTIQQPAATVQVPSIAPMPTPIASSTAPTVESDPSLNRQRLYRNLENGRFSVTELQRRLQLRGFDPVEMNGVYDSATQNAVTQAQQAYGLSQSDLFD